MTSADVSVYIHIPFCKTRCFYCDFNTFAGKDQLIPDYVKALQSEITQQGAQETEAVHSIYFGGGTPSRLPDSGIRSIMETLRQTFRIRDDAEITFEANPCDITSEKAAFLAGCGINRISLGMQSAIPEELKRMGRRHTHEQTKEAVRLLKQAGFGNISLDLIYGYPEQTMESWATSLRAAADLDIQHISLYALSVEEGSALRRQIEAGRLSLPDDELTAEMYEQAADFLSARGFLHYEISNWAAESKFESRHNKQYWHVRPYYGFGAGAHGWIDAQRIRNEASITEYIRKTAASAERFPAAAEIIPQDKHIIMQDFMMLHLRLLEEGISPDEFHARFDEDMETVFRRELRHLIRKNLVSRSPDGRIRLVPDKVMVANQAFLEFVD